MNPEVCSSVSSVDGFNPKKNIFGMGGGHLIVGGSIFSPKTRQKKVISDSFSGHATDDVIANRQQSDKNFIFLPSQNWHIQARKRT